MGNPSDGFGGKTISFLFRNFAAEVKIAESVGTSKITLVENVIFQSLDHLYIQSSALVTNKLF
jgi:hypothetical protein